MLQGTLIQGTTPTHDFELPYPREIIEQIRITYGQENKKIITKNTDQCYFADGKVSVDLTQEETFSFSPGKVLTIEISIKLTNKKVLRNEEPIRLRVISSMNSEVIN